MFRIIKIKANNKIYFVSVNAIVKIIPNYTELTDKSKTITYSITFIDGSFLDNCIIPEDVVAELHIG